MSDKFSHWHQPAHQLWTQSQPTQAIEATLNQINLEVSLDDSQKNYYLFEQVSYYLFHQGDYMGAKFMLQQAMAHLPDDDERLLNYIICCSRLKENQEVIEKSKIYLKRQPKSPMIYDTLAVAFKNLNRPEQTKIAGQRSLLLKHHQVSQEFVADPTINQKIAHAKQLGAKQFLASDPSRTFNVVAFSLFGDNPRYLWGAIRNLSLMHDIYPNWQAWIYLDDSVPLSFRRLYEHMGAILWLMPSGASLRSKLTWRFQVASHPQVARFLVRDIDSVISTRESTAVKAWIADDTLFHVMRDGYTHTELILAGMWGGIGGIFDNINELIQNFQSTVLENRHVDQYFLRHCLWNYVSQSVSQHDSVFGLKTANIDYSNPWGDTFDAEHNGEGLGVGFCEHTLLPIFQKKMVEPWLLLMEQRFT